MENIKTAAAIERVITIAAIDEVITITSVNYVVLRITYDAVMTIKRRN